MIFGFQLGESFGSVALKCYRERNKSVSHFLPKKPHPNILNKLITQMIILHKYKYDNGIKNMHW